MFKKKVIKFTPIILVAILFTLPLFYLMNRYLLLFDAKQKILFKMMQFKPVYFKNSFFETINTLFLVLFIAFNALFFKKILTNIKAKQFILFAIITVLLLFMSYWILEIAT